MSGMLIDMVYDNPVEPPVKTRYRDPKYLGAMGYQAIVIPQALSALMHRSQQHKGEHTASAPERPRSSMLDSIDQRVGAALGLQMSVFFYSDAMFLPRALVE